MAGSKGLIHIYTGDGKGKTSAAAGLAVRFAGAGGKVLFTQFLKDGKSSEISVLNFIPGIDVYSFTEPLKFVWLMSEDEKKEAAEKYNGYLTEIISKVRVGGYGMLVLDEALAAYSLGFIDSKTFLSFLDRRPESLEVVMTGRNPAPELAERADYLSEVRKVKHPYDSGVQARRGIEF